MTPFTYIGTNYLELAFTKPAKVVATICKRLERVKFDAIVVTGLSGLLVGPLVAEKLKKRLCVVRKADDHSTHSGNVVEGWVPSKYCRYIVLDDLVATGETVKRCRKLYEWAAHGNGARAVYVGLALWSLAEWAPYKEKVSPKPPSKRNAKRKKRSVKGVRT